MDSYTLSTLVVGVVLMTKVLWELQFSPLARQHIPGPKWAAISDLWTYWLMIRRRRTSTYDTLFQRYGPVVRVGPNRVAFRNIETVKTIYSPHMFRKSSFYGVFTVGGAENIFSTQDPVSHARSRRLSTPAFRGENLRAAGPVLLQEMEDLVGRLRRNSTNGGYVDVIQLFPELTLDILGLTVLGVRFNQIATGNPSDFEKNINYWLIDKLLLLPLPSVIRKLPIPLLQEILAADGAITDFVKNLYEQADGKSDEGRWSMLESYKSYRDADSGEPAPLSLVASDLGQMFIAGTETTAVVLIYLTYHLASHEDIWDTLRLELAQVNLQADGFTEALRRLPYLNAFLREILRIHGPAPVFLERVVPAGGATLDGYVLPAGTQVGGQAYSSHFDQKLFPQPQVVNPLRWVRWDRVTGQYVNREDITAEMNSNFFPFGIGVRSCSGKALADLELALITATIVKNFRISLHDTTTPSSMRPVELLAIRPQADRCLLRFEYAPDAAV